MPSRLAATEAGWASGMGQAGGSISSSAQAEPSDGGQPVTGDAAVPQRRGCLAGHWSPGRAPELDREPDGVAARDVLGGLQPAGSQAGSAGMHAGGCIETTHSLHSAGNQTAGHGSGSGLSVCAYTSGDASARDCLPQAGGGSGSARVREFGGMALREAGRPSEPLQASAGSSTLAGSATGGGLPSAEAGDWAGFGWGEEDGAGSACGDGDAAVPHADVWPDSVGGGSARDAGIGAPAGAVSASQPPVPLGSALSTAAEAAADALPCQASDWPAFDGEFDAPSGGGPAALSPLQPMEAVLRPAGPAQPLPVAEDAAASAGASAAYLGGIRPAEEPMPWLGDAAGAADAYSGARSGSTAAGEVTSALTGGGEASQPPEGPDYGLDASAWGTSGDPPATLFPPTGLPSEPAALDRQSSWGSFGGARSPSAGGAPPPVDAWQIEAGYPEGSVGGAGSPEGSGLQGLGRAGRTVGPPGAGGAAPPADAWPSDGRACDAYWEQPALTQDAGVPGMNALGNGTAGAVSSHMPTRQVSGPGFAEAPIAAGGAAGAWGFSEGWGAGALSPGNGEIAAHNVGAQRNVLATAGAVSGGGRAGGGASATGRQHSQDLPLQGAGSSNDGCHRTASIQDEGLAIPDLTFMLADAIDKRCTVRSW